MGSHHNTPNHIVYGLYNDDDDLVEGAKALVAKGLYIKTAYSPFPIHGVEKVLGIKWTRLAICSFIYGMLAMGLALFGLWYFMIHDWPMNIGGKPNWTLYHNLPSFIPVTFEFTVFCAAHGMALTYFIRNWTFPGVTPRNPHPRTTDDHFALEIHTNHNPDHSVEDLANLLKETAVVEVFEQGTHTQLEAIKA